MLAESEVKNRQSGKPDCLFFLDNLDVVRLTFKK